jgi:hypothetical protein
MTDYTGSITPAAGQGFILKGGDTWVASDLGDVWKWGGTSGSPIYIGVDQTWFVGGSWTRPIFSCGGASCSGTGNYANYFMIVGSYVTIDNIEFTGLLASGTNGQPSYVVTELDHDIVENSYFHGWTMANGATRDAQMVVSFSNNNFPPYTSQGSGLFFSVIDGSDTARNSMHAIGGSPTYIVGNVIQYVTNTADNIQASNVHDNYFGPVVLSFQSGAHQNVLSVCCADNSNTNQFFYNNVFTGTTCGPCGGVVKLWLDQFGTSNTVGYAFNNVIYNNAPGNMINQGHGTAGTNVGTWNFFNNTVECGTDTSQAPCVNATGVPITSVATFNSINNHWISSTAPIVCSGGYSCPETSDLTQSISKANGQGYSSARTFVFPPASGSGSTVAAGTNVQSMCATINGLDATAGAACKKDTGYACSYSTGNHTVSCPARTPLLRPVSGNWDVGGYQWTGSSAALQPSCSRESGTYSSTQTVTCTNPNTGTTAMCYTTDGSLPITNYPTSKACSHGTVYNTAISVASSETLSVVASTTLLSDSTQVQYVYTIGSQAATSTFR